MRAARNLRLSARALLRHRVRTLLGLSGIAVGVAAVLVMVALGDGARDAIRERIEAMGRDQLVVRSELALPLPGRGERRVPVQTLRLSDAEAVAALPSVAQVAANVDAAIRVKYGTLSMVTTIRGTTPEYAIVRNFPAGSGRWFTAAEDARAERVAVIGDRVRERLFGDADPLGQLIRVGSVPFEVVGVLVPRGAGVDGGSDQDDQIVIPLKTALRRVLNRDYLNLLFVRARPGRVDRAAGEIEALLRGRHRMAELGRSDDFSVFDQRRVIEADLEANARFRRLILGIGTVALLLGGVGILSIMLLSVRERRGEVGLRMAVGARVRDVRRQFLAEALLLGGAGGALGVGAGILGALSLGWATEWRTSVTWEATVVALGGAMAVTVLFGVLPAQRAAALDPVDALRRD